MDTGSQEVTMKEVLEYVAKALVARPDQVRVTALEGERSVILQLRVDPEDVGRIIGKNGRTVKAIRTLMQAAATRAGRNAIVEIVG